MTKKEVSISTGEPIQITGKPKSEGKKSASFNDAIKEVSHTKRALDKEISLS